MRSPAWQVHAPRLDGLLIRGTDSVRPPVTALLCDLDGTMIDTAPDLATATSLTLNDMGFKGVGERDVRAWVGKGARHLVTLALQHAMETRDGDSRVPKAAAVDTALARFEAHYESHLTDNSRLYDDVGQTLDTLAGRGIILGCVTNKPERFTRVLLRHFGLEPLFSVVVGGDSLAQRKPDPAPIHHALRAMNSAARNAMLIGDSMNDALAARRAGMRVVCVDYGYHGGVDVTTLGATAVIGGFAAVLEYC